MLSVLVTDKSIISKDVYEIPPNITYRDLRVERVILSNNWDNITDNVWKMNVDNVEKTIIIPNGRYTEQDYADYLQQYLGANTSNVQWYVTFNKNTNKFDIRANNQSNLDVTVKPNEQAQNSTGFPAQTTYSANNHMSQGGSEKSDFQPSYVTIRSRSLNNNGYAYKRMSSDIICFFPLQSDESNSVWQETTSFLTDNNSLRTINNQIDLQFYLRDEIQIENPIFSLELTFA